MGTYNNFQNYAIRISEAEANIDKSLHNKFDLLNRSIDIIKANAKIDKDIFVNIKKLRSRKLSSIELDNNIRDGIKEFTKYKEEYPELKKSEAFNKIDVALNETEAEIIAYKKYYNDIVSEYNKLVKKIPSNFIALICKFKAKPFLEDK